MARDLNYDPDSGAGSAEDAMKDADHPSTERSEGDVGETTFNPSDAPSAKQNRFRELRKRHHSHFDQDPKQYNDTNVAYDARMVCNRLEMTEYQQTRALKLIEGQRQQGRRYEETIMGVVTFVLNEEDRWIQRDDDDVGDDCHDQWMELLETFNIDRNAVSKVRNEVRSAEYGE